jgi:cytochrome c-type biogenesis protein CcmH
VSTFIVVAALMVIAVLAWTLLPLLRRRAVASVDQSATNLRILKDQLADLAAEHASGALSDATYADTKADLDRRVIEEQQMAPEAVAPAPARWHGRVTAAAIVVAVPLLSALMYAKFGNLDAFDPMAMKSAEDVHSMNAGDMDKVVARLEERLKADPGNAEGWSILARTYYQQRKFKEASDAYAKLAALVPDDADLLADYADALAMARGRKLAGEPMDLVNKALVLDPKQWKALAMAGTDAFDRKDYKAAIEYWERLRVAVPPESPIGQQISSSIAEARQAAGMQPAPEAKATAKAEVPATQAKPVTGAKVSGTVSLNAKLAANAKPEDTVIVFARPAEGSKMPVAITRMQVRDLPAKFSLDDSMAMSADATLSKLSEVVIAARITKGGMGMPQAGDMEGFSKPVKIGAAGVAVEIDQVRK